MHKEMKTKFDSKDSEINQQSLNAFNKEYTSQEGKVKADTKKMNLADKRTDDILNAIANDPTSDFYYIA